MKYTLFHTVRIVCQKLETLIKQRYIKSYINDKFWCDEIPCGCTGDFFFIWFLECVLC